MYVKLAQTVVFNISRSLVEDTLASTFDSSTMTSSNGTCRSSTRPSVSTGGKGPAGDVGVAGVSGSGDAGVPEVSGSGDAGVSEVSGSGDVGVSEVSGSGDAGVSEVSESEDSGAAGVPGIEDSGIVRVNDEFSGPSFLLFFEEGRSSSIRNDIVLMGSLESFLLFFVLGTPLTFDM